MIRTDPRFQVNNSSPTLLLLCSEYRDTLCWPSDPNMTFLFLQIFVIFKSQMVDVNSANLKHSFRNFNRIFISLKYFKIVLC